MWLFQGSKKLCDYWGNSRTTLNPPPRLLYRISEEYLALAFDLSERTLLYQEPPRTTRIEQSPLVQAVPSTGAPV